MAEGEDMELKTRRLRTLLSSYYGPSATGAQSGNGASESQVPGGKPGKDINSKGFDVDRYLKNLLQRTRLDALLSKHVEMAAEIKNLDSDMQMLVYENYNKFISATDTIRRMKDNVSSMETSMEQLLETVTAVRAKSDGVNSSLFERRERIEQLNGTRSLLRKTQFVFDLPKRLRKCQKEGALAQAIKYYVGALPILKTYGNTSFQTCREEAEEVMHSITEKLQTLVMSDDEPAHVRAEATSLLQQLGQPIDSLMSKFLTRHWGRLIKALEKTAQISAAAIARATERKGVTIEGANDSKSDLLHSPRSLMENLNKDFIEDFAKTAAIFREVFPSGEDRLTEAAQGLFNEYFEQVRAAFQPENSEPSASELILALRILSMDVVKLDDLVPTARLQSRAREAMVDAVKQHVQQSFELLTTRTNATLAEVPSNATEAQKKADQSLALALEKMQMVVLVGSLEVLKDLQEFLSAGADVLADWRDEYIDLVHAQFQDLFATLHDHFLSVTAASSSSSSSSSSSTGASSTTPTGAKNEPSPSSSEKNTAPAPPALVLLLARLCVFVEQIAIPRIMEVLASNFSGGGSRGEQEQPAFLPSEVCRSFRAASEKLLQQYVDMQSRKLSTMIKRSVAAPNWLKCKEPRDVRMFVDLFLQEIENMEAEVVQLLDPGSQQQQQHRRTRSAGASTGEVANFRSSPGPADRSGRSSVSQGVAGNNRGAARSRFLERDVAKLFAQQVEIFTKIEFTQSSVVSLVIKLSLKSFQECVRLETFSRSGFQQMQLDTHYLRTPLREFLDDETITDTLLDEVCAAAADRCVDPTPLELAIMERIIASKKSKA